MTARAVVLAIETSNPSAGSDSQKSRATLPQGDVVGPGVALGRANHDGSHTFEDAEPLAHTSRHDDDLVPAISRLFERHNLGPSHIGRVCVSVGPGGYTGLRIAISVARMIAEVSGAKVYPVESWRVPAAPLEPELGPALICLASKKETCYGAFLEQLPGPGAWAEPAHVGLIDAQTLARLGPRTIVADKYFPDVLREAARRCSARVLPPVFTPGTLLGLAAHARAVGPAEVVPLYPREPDAVTQWRARHG